MTPAQQKQVVRLVKEINLKLDQIERNFKLMRGLHAFEVKRLKAKLRQRKRAGAR